MPGFCKSGHIYRRAEFAIPIHKIMAYTMVNWLMLCCMSVHTFVRTYMTTIQLCCICSTQLICLGIMIASAVALSTVAQINLFDDDIPDDSDSAEDRDRFRTVAGYVLCASVVGIVTQLLLAANRGFYHCKVIKPPFYIFKVLVSS